MPMLQRFAAGRKVLRRDVPKSPRPALARRGFLATVAAGLGLAARPAVADEWIVEPDEPGLLMQKWRAVQRAQADRDACPRPTSWDDQAAVDVQAEHCDRRDALLADLVESIAADAGTDLADPKWLEVERDSMDEVPGLAAVREGSTLFTLTYGSGHGVADHYVELGQREHNGRSIPIGYFARPVVFEGFFADPSPATTIPPELAASLEIYGAPTRFVVLPPGRELPPLGVETARFGLGYGWCLVLAALIEEGLDEAGVRRELRTRCSDLDRAMPPGTFDPSRLGFGRR